MKLVRNLPWTPLGILFAITVLVGCGGKVRFDAGERLLKGELPAEVKAPDTLRADLELTGFERGKKTSVSAALSAVPGSRYKLDVYGLPGMVEASFLWTDTGWVLVIFGREGYLQGYGDTVDLPGLGIGGAPVHDLFAPLWGDFFPGDSMGGPGDSGTAGEGAYPWPVEKAEEGAIRYLGQGGWWTARLDPKTGLVREAVQEDSAFRVVYGEYKSVGGRPVPKRVAIFGRGKPLLEIAVGKVEDRPVFRKDPFRIKIPKGFERLRLQAKP